VSRVPTGLHSMRRERDNDRAACLHGVSMRTPPIMLVLASLAARVRLPRLPRGAARYVVMAAAAAALTAAPAHAVSVADIEQLARAGLGDEVLVALIQIDNTVFPLDAERILELRAAGVSERVIVAMLRNGRPPSPAGPDFSSANPHPGPFFGSDPDIAYDDPPALEVPPPASPVVVEVHAPPPSTAGPVLYVPYPVVAAPRGARRPAAAAPPFRGFGRFINDGWVERGGSHRTSP